jgi:hypothetical protein
LIDKIMALSLLICTALLPAPCALAAEQLSDRVRQVIEAKGIKNAQQEIPALFQGVIGGNIEADEAGMLALADEYIATGNYKAALFALQLQASVAKSPNVMVKMGDLYMAQNAAPVAAALYQQALQADPGNDYAKRQLEAAMKQNSAYPFQIPVPSSQPKKPEVPVRAAPPLIVIPKGPRGGSQLLPYVIVTDLKTSRNIDWPSLRARAGQNYVNRWDDLTLIDACLWIPPQELREKFGIDGRITARYTDHQCKFWVHATDANKEQMVKASGAESTLFLQVRVELHDSAEYPRGALESMTDGIGRMQYTQFDVGASDLVVLTHHKAKHLYVYSKGGRTMWRLGYKAPGVERDLFYDPTGKTGVGNNIGMRYLQLLVKKYGGQL